MQDTTQFFNPWFALAGMFGFIAARVLLVCIGHFLQQRKMWPYNG